MRGNSQFFYLHWVVNLGKPLPKTFASMVFEYKPSLYSAGELVEISYKTSPKEIYV